MQKMAQYSSRGEMLEPLAPYTIVQASTYALSFFVLQKFSLLAHSFLDDLRFLGRAMVHIHAQSRANYMTGMV